MYLAQIIDAITGIAGHFLKKDGTNSATANIDLGSQKIVNLANGENPNDAVNFSQLESVAQSGGVRGSIIGAIKNVSGSPKFYYKDSGATTENAAAIAGLYITLEEVVLDTVTYPINSVLKYGSGVWFLDSTNATLGTFDSSAAYADVGGMLAQSARYQLLFDAYAGHSLPNSDVSGWGDGDRIDWNAAYDTSGDNNVGRWVHSQSEALPDATNAIKGKAKTGAGIQNLTGEIAANIDTARGLSWSDSTTNKPFGLNIITDFFEFVGGALNLKDASITLAKLASDVTTYITSSISTAIAALTASNIPVVDSANVLSGTNLETVTQELAKKAQVATIASHVGGFNDDYLLIGKWDTDTAPPPADIDINFTENGIAIYAGQFSFSGGNIYNAEIRETERSFYDLSSGASTGFTMQLAGDGTHTYLLLKRDDATTGSGVTAGGKIQVSSPAGTFVMLNEWVLSSDTRIASGLGNSSQRYYDSRYYTETETDALLAGKSNTGHTHTASAITDFTAAVQTIGDARYGIPYQSTQNLGSDLTSGTVALTALSPLPVNAQCVQVNINGAALKYGSDFTVNAGTGVITLVRSAIGYDVLTTYDVNIAWQGVS